MRATILAAGGLACAGAAMTIAAFAGGGSEDKPPAPATAQAPPHVASEGVEVWIANGCGGCHTFKAANSDAPIGPDLGQTLRGEKRDYVMRSIVLPNADTPPGFTTGGMPEDFAERISPADLELLVDFILAGVRAEQ